MQKNAKRGFTIVEMLVVIAIIGILIGLLVPAVQAGRARSRVKHCQSNMRQIGYAIQQYLTNHKMLPISISPWPEGMAYYPQRNGKGWLVSILPHLDQANLFKYFDFNGDFSMGGGLMSNPPGNPRPREALEFRVEVFTCPDTEDDDLKINNHPYFPGIWVSSTNYKGVIGDTVIRFVGPNPASTANLFPIAGSVDCSNTNPCNGLFWRNSYQFPKRWERFSDGTSQTFMMGEDLPKHNSNSVWCFADSDWATCSIPLNYKPQPPTPTDYINVTSFRSNHQGGANFLYADGQVKFINEQIDYRLYRALSTRDNHKAEGPLTDLP